MATTKVSALTAKVTPAGTEELLINDSGVSKKITIDNVTENNFTDVLKTKVDAIETSATADQTGAEIKTAYELELNTNAYTDADKTKLDGIEALADVTDVTNVTAAGALMDSEVTNLAQVKAFATTDYATAAQGTTADAALPKAGGTMTGTIAGFTSTGIDDNATSTAITIDASENVGIGTTAPATLCQIGSTGITTSTATESAFAVHKEVSGGAAVHYLINSAPSTTGVTSETSELYLGWRDGASGIAIAPRIVAGKEGDYKSVAAADSYLAFKTSNNNTLTEQVRIQSGGGISFNGDTAAANALDDYEEGTFTPGIAFGGGVVGITYTTQVGAYTKIGDVVTASGVIALSAKGTSTGLITLTGLPFASSGTANTHTTPSFYLGGVSHTGFVMAFQNPSSTDIYMRQINTAGTRTNMTDANILSGTSSVNFNLTYRV